LSLTFGVRRANASQGATGATPGSKLYHPDRATFASR
jgi:hypothetical protein